MFTFYLEGLKKTFISHELFFVGFYLYNMRV